MSIMVLTSLSLFEKTESIQKHDPLSPPPLSVTLSCWRYCLLPVFVCKAGEHPEVPLEAPRDAGQPVVEQAAPEGAERGDACVEGVTATRNSNA